MFFISLVLLLFMLMSNAYQEYSFSSCLNKFFLGRDLKRWRELLFIVTLCIWIGWNKALFQEKLIPTWEDSTRDWDKTP